MGTPLVFLGCGWLFIAIYCAELTFETEKGEKLKKKIENLFK